MTRLCRMRITEDQRFLPKPSNPRRGGMYHRMVEGEGKYRGEILKGRTVRDIPYSKAYPAMGGMSINKLITNLPRSRPSRDPPSGSATVWSIHTPFPERLGLVINDLPSSSLNHRPSSARRVLSFSFSIVNTIFAYCKIFLPPSTTTPNCPTRQAGCDGSPPPP